MCSYLGLELSHQAVPYLFYYVDYLIPAFVLGAIVIVGELLRAVQPRVQRIAAGATVAGLFVAYLVLQNWTIGKHDIGRPLLAIGVIALVAVLAHRYAPRFVLVVVLVTLAVAPLAFVVRDNANYVSVASGQGQSTEWDVYSRSARIPGCGAPSRAGGP